MNKEDSKPFWKSATKIALLLLTLALIIGLFIGKIDSKDFFYIVGQVYAFYFGQKTINSSQI